MLNKLVYNYGTYVDNKLNERHHKTHKPKHTYSQILHETSRYADRESKHYKSRNATAESLRSLRKLAG